MCLEKKQKLILYLSDASNFTITSKLWADVQSRKYNTQLFSKFTFAFVSERDGNMETCVTDHDKIKQPSRAIELEDYSTFNLSRTFIAYVSAQEPSGIAWYP